MTGSESRDQSTELAARVRAASAAAEALEIVGGASKRFLGRAAGGTPLAVGAHTGIVSYEPTELVITARGGTPLAELRQTLAEHEQMLAFEPPAFGPAATIGGTVACGLSGPRRPWAGALRDFVLGVKILNGRGEILHFGGQVMKNVAGYDLSRLMAGAMGTLGVLLEVSLKVLPRPSTEWSLGFELDPAAAVARVNAWSGRPLPLSGACHDGTRLRIRLSGTANGVATAARRLGGERLDTDAFWDELREQRLPFFAGERPLWRLSLPPAAEPAALDGAELCDWGGAQRWLRSDTDAAKIRAAAARLGGQATLFRHGDRHTSVYHPLPPALMVIHQRLKAALDPNGILNPGRLYPEL